MALHICFNIRRVAAGKQKKQSPVKSLTTLFLDLCTAQGCPLVLDHLINHGALPNQRITNLEVVFVKNSAAHAVNLHLTKRHRRAGWKLIPVCRSACLPLALAELLGQRTSQAVLAMDAGQNNPGTCNRNIGRNMSQDGVSYSSEVAACPSAAVASSSLDRHGAHAALAYLVSSWIFE